MKKISIYTIALTTATLAASPCIVDEYSSARGAVYDSLNLIASQKSATGKDNIDCRQYLNSMWVRKSFGERMLERNISDIPSDIEQSLLKVSEECGKFDIKEVYADYSPVTHAIRIDMIIDKDFLLMVRNTFEDDEDRGVAVSLSKGNENVLADYIDMNMFVDVVNHCIKG